MTNKYEARIFPNGRVVCYKRKDLDDAIEAGKDLLIICNCRCGGYALAIGADKTIDWHDSSKTVYMMHSYNLQNKEFTGEEMSKFYKVIFTEGEHIFDTEGDYATGYFYWDHYFYKENNIKMKVSNSLTARFLSREKVEAMIDLGILTQEALKYCEGIHR